jgi:hypothetical protein
MKSLIRYSTLIATIIIVQACAPSKNLQVTEARESLPKDCIVDIFPPDTEKPETYDVLATIKIDDAGLSVSCGKEQARETMRVEACRIGANAIIIQREHNPSLVSTCYRATAELVHVEN